MLRRLLRPACRELVYAVVLLCAAAVLIACPQQSMQAAQQGISLCAETIVPSLFPFFVLSGMVVELGLARHLGRLVERVMWPLFRVNGAGATALVLGLVGGYPVGARTAIELYQKGCCSQTETERLLAFCNNSGPAFILGVVGAGVFGSGRAGLALYLVHVAASVCVGVLFRFYGGVEERCKPDLRPAGGGVSFALAFTRSVRSALTGVLNICAFVMTFSVILGLLARVGVLETLTRALTWFGMDAQQAYQLLRGLLEVSSGVRGLAGSGRLPMAAFMLGWAGLCVHCQVLSFLMDSGLRVGTYLAGKALHGALSALFAVGLVRWFPNALPAAGWLVPQVENGLVPKLSVSMAAAWVLWLGFLAVALFGRRNRKKRGGKGRQVAV
ncbi:MAG: sporulation protein [Ruminococcaceae bacterium]|nr:sporulation protein [Oscillospiraceae bacterium]